MNEKVQTAVENNRSEYEQHLSNSRDTKALFKSPGAQARVTRGLEPTPLRGLVTGPRNAFLESKNDGDG